MSAQVLNAAHDVHRPSVRQDDLRNAGEATVSVEVFAMGSNSLDLIQQVPVQARYYESIQLLSVSPNRGHTMEALL